LRLLKIIISDDFYAQKYNFKKREGKSLKMYVNQGICMQSLDPNNLVEFWINFVELLLQPSPKKKVLNEEVKAAAAAAVSRMKDVPPRYARLNAQSQENNDTEPASQDTEPHTNHTESQTERESQDVEPLPQAPEPLSYNTAKTEPLPLNNGLDKVQGEDRQDIQQEEEGSFNQLVMPIIQCKCTNQDHHAMKLICDFDTVLFRLDIGLA
jgi:hypothetical protein